jgi:hypothetical protein
MTVFMPPINLDDHATPWAKAIQQRMDDVELAASRSTNEGNNANSTQVAYANVLARQIADLAKTEAGLATAQTTLAKNVTGLANVVSLLGSLASAGVSTDSGMALPTSDGNATLFVPVGMTTLVYTVAANGSGLNSTGSTGSVLLEVTGPNGNSGYASTTVEAGAQRFVSCSTVGTVTGLVAGQSVTFQTSLKSNTPWAANAANWISTQVVGTFQP